MRALIMLKYIVHCYIKKRCPAPKGVNMPNIKSQKKRVLITKEEYLRNKSIRSEVKNAVKKFNAAIAAGDVAEAEALLPVTVSVINKAKSDGVYHINTASRKIASLYKSLNSVKA